MNYREINQMNQADATTAFMQCCTSTAWVAKMVASRPYKDRVAIIDAANDHWVDLEEQDYLQAFDGHPKIGDVSSLMKKYANTKKLAAGEQSGIQCADQETINELAKGNQDYLDKFGFIFIVCASGKSASEMNALLQARILNDRDTELKNAAEEQRKIFQLRLNKFC